MEDLQPVVQGTRLVPEKRALSVATQTKLRSLFWGTAVKSTRTPDGTATAAPSEPVPLSLLTPSGLSRVQFLQATQAVGIPATPSFTGSQGGVVMDRALSMHGGQNWWAAFVGRVKLQQLLARQRSNGAVKALVDPSLYALHGVLRARPSRTTFLRASIQADSLAGLVAPPPAGPAPKLADALSASSELTAHISSHKLTGRLSANELVLTAPATYSRAPFTATVDLEPLPRRQSPLLYRLGLHQTVARLPAAERKPQALQQNGAASNGRPQDGEAAEQGGAAARGGVASSSGRRLLQDFASSCSIATVLQGAAAVHGSKVLWQSQRSNGSRQESGSPPEEPSGSASGVPAAQQPATHHAAASYQDGGEGSDNGRLITAGDALAALSVSASMLREATQHLGDATGWVRSGAFRDALQGRSSGRNASRRPRNSFLSGPHLQATGLLGAAARTGFSSTGGLARPALAPFASGALSLQLGQFARPLLDFTRLSAQLDLGLARPPSPAPATPTASPLGLPDARPSATLSVTQQLYGPLRLNADWRLALDSDTPLAGWRDHPMEQAGRAWRHVRGLRPSLVDAAYALDVVVPGSKGLARVVAWYAPLRKEGMLELRLL